MALETISHYRILEQLGAGGMGEVYLAQDMKLDRTVAVKLLPEEVASDRKLLQRFFREAKAASALNHPNVCVIHEVGEADDGRPFIAMEYIEGQRLDAKIGGQPLEIGQVVDIGIQIADALDEAHSKGVIHRDIKPSNVIITPRRQVKVLDFGLAKFERTAGRAVASDTPTEPITEPGTLLGTVQYMSPEQALGVDVDARTDLFSLGVVLFEMATGRQPFAGKTPIETLDRVLHAQPESFSRLNYDVPPEFEYIVRKCLRKEPTERYQAARDLVADLMTLKRQLSGVGSFEPARPLEPEYFISRGAARWLFVALQGVYLAMYAAALHWSEPMYYGLEHVLGWKIGYYLSAFFIISAIIGIAIRLYLISVVVFDHVRTGVYYRRIFPLLFLLDMCWAVIPLSLSRRISEVFALALIPPLVFSPFSQRTLVRSAYDLRAPRRTSIHPGR